MRITTIMKTLLPALAIALASCRSAKTVETGTAAAGQGKPTTEQTVRKVAAVSHRETQYVTSKIKVELSVGGKDLSLSGNLRMKRDGVIRLQLVAFGLIEAGRIEFTPDYVLLMDRINRQYIKVNYGDVAFLRESGLNFNSLQSLFWGELFVPGEAAPGARSLAGFNAYEAGTDMALMLERSPLTYRWVADKGSGQVKTANVTYKDAARGNTQLTWHYGGFEQMGRHKFPTTNDITVTTPKHTVRLSYSLGGIGHDSGWETPTEVTSRYRQVKLDDILRKLSSL